MARTSTETAQQRPGGLLRLGTAVIYIGLTAYAHSTDWTRAAPEEWVSYAGLTPSESVYSFSGGWPSLAVRTPERRAF